LHKDGVIFISMDDHEIHHLRNLCDSIFGRDNHVATIPLEITKTQGFKLKSAAEGTVVKNHEYIMCYSKSSGNKKIVKNLLYDHRPGYDTHYSFWIDNPDKPGKIKKLTEVLADNKEIKAEFQRLNLLKENGKITNPMIADALLISPIVRKFIYEDHAKNIFQEMMAKLKVPDDVKAKLKNDTATLHEGYYLKKNGNGNMVQMGQLSGSVGKADDNAGTFGLRTIRGSLWKGFYSDMMNVAKEGGGVPFKNGKKPVRLIKQLAHWIGIEEDDIVLDAFAGSGTTGEAVMQMNAEDNGNRRFILIQWAQDLSEPKGDDQKAAVKFCKDNDLPLNIISLTKERLKRAHNKILEGNPDSSANLGFKMYKYVPSNIKNWNNSNPEDLQKTLEEFINVVNEDSSMLDIFTEMILFHGIDLAAPVTISSVGDHEIFDADNGRMLACFSNEKISSDSIPDIAKELIQKKNNGNHESNCIAIFLDNSFEDDEAKTNLKLDLESGEFAPSHIKCI
jgi:adenine-specific DNA-methyltransferase